MRVEEAYEISLVLFTMSGQRSFSGSFVFVLIQISETDSVPKFRWYFKLCHFFV